MVSRPEQWVKPMAAAGANQYTFHLEATTNPGNLIKEIRESGMKVCEKGKNGHVYIYIDHSFTNYITNIYRPYGTLCWLTKGVYFFKVC